MQPDDAAAAGAPSGQRRAALPARLQRRAQHHLLQARAIVPRLDAWLRYLAHRREYTFVGPDALRARRRSDTVYVFGSGASLNDITADEWARIAQHDTFGFNWFVRQRFVRCDFMLVRGIPDTDLDRSIWLPQLHEYFALVREGPQFADTAFLVQSGFRATNGNRALGYRLLPAHHPVLPWRTRTDLRDPSRSFDDGLVHRYSVLLETINAAYLLGWKRIVLVGVDLYDRRYFWLPPDEARTVDQVRGATAGDVHSRAGTGMEQEIARWAALLEQEGVRLEVYNPRSLLVPLLPLHDR